MLTVVIPQREYFNKNTLEFVVKDQCCFQMAHSLISISKWESKWKTPFLSDKEKTTEQTIDYIRCMTITKNLPPDVYTTIPDNVYKDIVAYINDPHTATWFNDQKPRPKNGEAITSELIYYQMVAHNIPFECEKWHLSRLLTLIKVCNIKAEPPKKMNKREMLSKRNALNNSRRSQINSGG